MILKKTPLARFLTWSIILMQSGVPIATAQTISEMASPEEQWDTWLADKASTLAAQAQEGNLDDYAKSQLRSYPESLANQAITTGINKLLPNAQFRGGVSLDSTRFRSAEVDLLIPVWENSSALMFGQFGLRTHDNDSFNGRTFINAGIGYRQDHGDWLLGVNTFLDADVRYNHLRGSVGLEAFRDTISLSGNYYFPLTNWKESKVIDFHDERPAQGFDIKAKGSLPSVPWIGAELALEKYYGDKVDILGNDTLTKNPQALSGAVSWRPVPIVEFKAGYKDAGSGGSQGEGSININYAFGTPLSDQLDSSRVVPATNASNKTAFVDRNNNIVMEFREQASKISVNALPVSGVAGQTVTLHAGISSRYPVSKVEWFGDQELMAGLHDPSNLNSSLTLPNLPLDITHSKEYGLFIKVTDSRGNSVTSERIPVVVQVNPDTFRAHLNVIHDDVRYEDGVFVLPSPEVGNTDGSIIEWHYVRERSKNEWTSIKPDSVSYSSEASNLSFKSLGGEERDGHWIERVQVIVHEQTNRAVLQPIDLNITATGPNGSHTVTGTVRMTPEIKLINKVSSVAVVFEPGTDELNGSTKAPVVGSTLQAKTLCEATVDCTADFNYQWEVSKDGTYWHSIPGATTATWMMPAMLDNRSMQDLQVRVRVVSEING